MPTCKRKRYNKEATNLAFYANYQIVREQEIVEQSSPQQTPNAQVSASAATTFSAEVAKENTVSSEAFENNQNVLAAHRRGILFRAMWIVLILLLLAALASVTYFTVRSRGAIGKTITAADNYNPTSLNISGVNSGPLNGQLTVNGNQLNTGNLTVLGTINGAGNINIGGDANVGGTLTASTLQGSLNASFITGSLPAGSLPSDIAYLDHDFQAFTGTNQIFRNASNSIGAFEIQDATGSPVLSVDTANNFVGIGSSAPNYNLDVEGTGSFSGQLLVGPNATPQGTILNAGGLFGGRDISRTLTTQQIINSNSTNRGIYAGLANELLIEPTIDPAGNDNYFAGSYSALQTNGTFDYDLNGGALASYAHNGTGTVDVGVGNFSLVSNLNSGTINRATGNLALPAINGGTINSYAGFSAFNPQLFALPQLGFPSIINGGTISKYFGVQVLDTSSASPINQLLNPLNNLGTVVNANISSEGTYSQNFFEGKVKIGICSGSETSNILCNLVETAPGGNKLIVNNPSTADTNASIQVTSRVTTDKPLVVQGMAGQTGNLTQWQDSTGTAKSVITANGSAGIGTNSPGAFRLNVTDTSTTNVAQFNGSGATQCTVISGTGWSCSSDESLKTNILSVANGLDVISQLRGVTYNWKSDPDGVQQDGFIAQEVQKILPQLVSTDSNGKLSLNKDGILPYLVNAIQQQQTQIDALKNGQQVSGAVFSGGIVTTDTEFQAKVTFNALVTHQADVVFSKNTTFNGTATFNDAIAGSTANRGKTSLAAGAIVLTVGLDGNHSGTPNVQLTPASQIDGNYWVSGSSVNGFIIHLEKPQATTVEFNWFIID